ncbi:MAG: site-2 protease family protein [Actinomycetota bacterium]
MNDSIRFGRILGIPVGIHWGALVLGLLFTVSLATTTLAALAPDTSIERRSAVAAAAVLAFFVSILAHEFGHAVAARHHGVGVAGITLWVMGGVAKLEQPAPHARAEFQIAIAGPAVSAAAGIFFGSLAVIADAATSASLAVIVLIWLAGINIILAVFNLLPGAPLDGGRVLTAWLWHHNDDGERSRVIAGRCGLVLGVGLVAAGLWVATSLGDINGWFTVAVGLMVFFAARAEIAVAAVRARLAGTTVADHHRPRPTPVPHDTAVDRLQAMAGVAGRGVAFPVVRWDHRPIGYVVPAWGDRLGEAERSWTPVHQLMHEPAHVVSAPVGAPVAALVDAWTEEPERIVISLDTNGVPVGTLTYRQALPLFERPSMLGLRRGELRRSAARLWAWVRRRPEEPASPAPPEGEPVRSIAPPLRPGPSFGPPPTRSVMVAPRE